MAVDLVNVTNVGDKPIEGSYGGNGYLIRPGETVAMEVECAKKDFGDYDARNRSKTEKRLRFREDQLNRIRGRYGVTPGAKVPISDENGNPSYDEKGVPKEILADLIWKDRLPKVEIHKWDGSRVVTVLEDPEGTNLPPGDDAEPDEKDAAIAAMRAEIEKLSSAVVELQSTPKAPVDSPAAPRPRPKPAKVTASQSVED